MCQCDCGRITVIKKRALPEDARSLWLPATREGGRGRKENMRHGESRHAGNTTEYRIWHGIIQRCCNSNDKAFKWYGGRGITVCDEWRVLSGQLSSRYWPPTFAAIDA